jgi:uncharacterized protein DUF1707
MATGPGDELEAAGRGHLRASHADRDQVVGALKAAFVQGRLDRDEFGLRVGQALTSRTYAELATLTADLPVGLTRARPPEPARQTVNKKAVAALTGATPALVGMMAAARAMPDATPWPLALPVIVITVVLFLAVPPGWLWLFHAWLDLRAGRQSAQGLPPGTGGEAYQLMAPADPGRQFPPADPGRQHTAEAARRRLPRPSLPGSRVLRSLRLVQMDYLLPIYPTLSQALPAVSASTPQPHHQ